MNSEYIQSLRYKLQKRVRRLNSVDHNLFHSCLKQFWHFLEQNSIFKVIIKEIEIKFKDCEEAGDKNFNGNLEMEHEEQLQIGVAYFVIKKCVESINQHKESKMFLAHSANNSNESIDCFREWFLDPFYEYIDEQLDEQNLVLNFLLRYKKKVEWFNKKLLHDKIKNAKNQGETRIEEKILSPHLYEYLFDQGIDFQIEPKIGGGKPDLLIEEMKRELVADSKIYNGKNKPYISNGVSQVYAYLQNTEKQFGYLIVFNPSEKTLVFDVKEQTQPLPYIQIGNKTIFLMVVDINPNRKTASNQTTKDIETISGNELLKNLKKQRKSI